MAQLMPMLETVAAQSNAATPFVSRSPAMQAVEQAVAQVARLQTPILLLGERGTGKSYLAQRAHEYSQNAGQIFYRLACGEAAPASMSVGWGDDLWTTGTLYLDELGLLSAPCQDRLAETFSGREGGHLPRFVSSSSRSLEEDVDAGRFREDLFFRLNGVSLRLPPLKHRPEDILPLANYFLELSAAKSGRTRRELSDWGQRCLLDYSWPGNLHELEVVMASFTALGDEKQALGEIQLRGRAATVPQISLKQAARAASREAERELILSVLQKTRWNRRKAAECLQISYKALLYKVKQIGVEETNKQ